MKTITVTKNRTLRAAVVSILLFTAAYSNAIAQDNTHPMRDEYYGHTLNLGVGIAYGGYYGQSVPFFTANYELQVARSFTLAPFIGIASYTSNNSYENGNNPNRYYYHETVVPIGLKASYYFDRLLGLNRRWDLYLAGSLGFTYYNETWDNGYTGDRNISTSPLYIDVHIGGEYHISRGVGFFLDLSTGVSTVGFAFHGHR